MQRQQDHTYRGEEEYGGHKGGRHNTGQQVAPGRDVWQKARSCMTPAGLPPSVHTVTQAEVGIAQLTFVLMQLSHVTA